MSLGNQRSLVSAYDYDLYEVVVDAADRDDAVRKAEAVYLTSNAVSIETFAPCGDMQWHAMPLVAEARQ